MGVSASISAKLQEDAKPAPVERHSPRAESKNTPPPAEPKDDKGSKDIGEPLASPAPVARRMSLQEMMTPASPFSPREESYVSILNSDQLTVGDIVRVTTEGKITEGMVIEKVTNQKLRVDFGDRITDCQLDDCVILIRNYEFEIGDKVECRPKGSNLFFVGKVAKINPDKTMDIMMDGDDPDDYERNVLPDDCRKLMSRRSVVVNRWKRAFMMVVAANFFKRISFAGGQGGQMTGLGPSKRILFSREEENKEEKV